jgi:hypothetical protein
MMTAAPTSNVNNCLTPGSGETIVPFESLAQGYRLSSSQSKPALFMAVDSTSRDAFTPLIDDEHRALLGEVDLERKAVLAAVWGVRPSGGNSITICSISLAKTGIIVKVIIMEDDPNVARVDASTYPYHLVLIDRLELPTDENLHYRLMSDDTLLAEGELP